MEQFKSLEEAPGYLIGDQGTVISPFIRRPLTPEIMHYGHLRVHVSTLSGRRRIMVHRLVLEAFVGPAPADKPIGCHRDGNPQNNTPENLYWGTPSSNTLDSVKHGTHNTAGREKTHCPQGHEYSGANLYITPKGDKRCRECHRERCREGYTPVSDPKPNFQSSKSHCPQGHPYDEANTHVSKRTGHRHCRACGRDRARRRLGKV